MFNTFVDWSRAETATVFTGQPDILTILGVIICIPFLCMIASGLLNIYQKEKRHEL